MQKDCNDFFKILSWFHNHNPFNLSAKLMCLDSGFINENNIVHCDQAGVVGAGIQDLSNNQVFTACSFKRKNQYIAKLLFVHISRARFCCHWFINTFLHLVVLVDWKPDTEIEDYFYYELTPYPLSLFKGGVMRTGKNKPSLNNFLLEGVRPSERTDSKVVVDEGALLWSCIWSKKDTFSKISQMYIDKCKRFGASAIVFDGYEASTKDATHNVRSGKMSQVVKIIAENSCSFDRVEFLTFC